MSKTLAHNGRIDVLIRQHVISLLREVLSDPDFGLLLKSSFTKKLSQSVQSKNAGKYKTLDEIANKYKN